MKGISFALFLLFTVAVQQSFAQQQQQTVPVPADTIDPPPTQQELVNKKIMNREPNKAALMSAVLPGSGQIYNKKYWKAPLAIIGLGVTAYLAHNYFLQTEEFGKAASLAERNGDRSWLSTSYTKAGHYNLQTLTATQLRTLQDDSRRYMYMNILIFSGVYALNIIDAYVDAHLKEFDVNDNLSFKVKPLFYATNYSHLATGLTLSIRLK